MSEQKVNYMAALDAWADANVIAPLFSTEADEESDWETQVAQVKTAIREKILESYRNGCKAGAGHVRSEYRQPAGQSAKRERSFAPSTGSLSWVSGRHRGQRRAALSLFARRIGGGRQLPSHAIAARLCPIR